MTTRPDWRREGIGVSPSSSSPWERKGHRRMSMDVYVDMDMDMAADNMAGPSRIPTDMDQQHTLPPSSSLHRQRQRRRKTPFHPSLISVLSPFLLPFLPTSAAAPPPSRPRAPRPPVQSRSTDQSSPSLPRITSLPTQTQTRSSDRLGQLAVQHLTSVTVPTTPIFPIETVDETLIPYLLTQKSDGTWDKAAGGWLLYGRRGVAATTAVMVDDGVTATTTSNTDPAATTATASQTTTSVELATYAVESALPNGWGSTSSRTSIYKVPLIVVASCIMAVAIVAFLTFIVIARRRRHRKQKRAKERLRRKALAAAGLSEADIIDKAAEAAFKDKLAELEEQRKSKKRVMAGKGGDSQGGAANAKSRVRGWNRRLGLRRRKIAKGDAGTGANGGQDDADEVKSVDGTSSSITTRASARTNDEQDRRSTRPRRSSVVSIHSTSVVSSPVISGSTEENAPQLAPPQPPSSNPTFFPPAYRPASVRSLAIPTHDAAESSGSNDSVVITHNGVGGPEKTQAPGYYPAPATEDGEAALAIAARSDGKARMIDHSDVSLNQDEEDAANARMRHVATDDKRLLEQMRLGASAPPAPGTSAPGAASGSDSVTPGDVGPGPSAPAVQTDEDGFELPDLQELQDLQEDQRQRPDERPPPLSTSTFSPGTTLPPPPTARKRIGAPPSANSTSSAPSSLYAIPRGPELLDEKHILPSAPPMSMSIAATDQIPSAPPLQEDGDDQDDRDGTPHPYYNVGEGVASAPPLNPDADEETDEETDVQMHPVSPGPKLKVEPYGPITEHHDDGQGEGHSAPLSDGDEDEDEDGYVDAAPTASSSRTSRNDRSVSATTATALALASAPAPTFLPRYEP